MAVPPNSSVKLNNDLRFISDSLVRVSSKLHEHTHQLEVAVEGTYASNGSDPRVRLLSDTLQLCRVADLELGRMNQAIGRISQTLQGQNGQGPGHTPLTQATPTTSSLDREREAQKTIINLKRERNELETLYDIARTLNSTLEFDRVLRLVMEQVISFMNAERGFLALVNPVTGNLDFTIALDKEARSIERSEFNISRSTVDKVVHTREPVLADDAQADLKGSESIVIHGIRSIMCAPLVVRNNCIGAVYVDSRINANLFGPKHRELLLAFCHQAAIAIDNARLFADLTKTIRQVNEDKQYMDNIFASIANGVITTDSEGKITTFNAAAARILRINPANVVGKHYRDIFSQRPQVGLTELLQNTRLEHEHGTMVTHSVDCDIPGAGMVNLNLYVSALRDTQNAHIGIALVIDDRTEIKRSEAQVKQIRRIFERYVHPKVVQQLIQNPMAINLGGETKEISVVFADIRGYTSLSETMAPEQVMNLLNSYLEIMVKEIWDEEGTVTAFIGDAIMAIFNAPLQQEDHALRAVRAAWKMRLAVLEYQRTNPHGVPIAFGFGVNTDFATIGNIGSHERQQNYTAIGDAVNVAARLQQNTSDNNILINHSTFVRTRANVKVAQMPPLQVKNKSAPLDVWSLVGLR